MADDQVKILPVTDRAYGYADGIKEKLETLGYRVEVDKRNEKTGRKIRDAQVEKVPYMIVVGDRDMEAGTLAPRHRSEGDLGTMSFDDFLALLKDDVDNKKIK